MDRQMGEYDREHGGETEPTIDETESQQPRRSRGEQLAHTALVHALLGEKPEVPAPRRPRGPKRHDEYEYDEDPGVPAVPVMWRTEALRRARQEAMHTGHDWSDDHEIAELSDVPIDIVRHFIARNRHRIGAQFLASELRRRTENGKQTQELTEHFSPQFVQWAVASLIAARQRYETQQALANPES